MGCYFVDIPNIFGEYRRPLCTDQIPSGSEIPEQQMLVSITYNNDVTELPQCLAMSTQLIAVRDDGCLRGSISLVVLDCC